MRGWGNGISSSSHCCKVFCVYRQDVSQTATVFIIIHSQTGNCSVSGGRWWFHKHSVRFWTLVVSTCATTPVFVAAFLNPGLFVSVSVGCFVYIVFCDGWLRCFSNQEWGSGLIPIAIQMGGVLAYLSNPALAWFTRIELNPLNLAMPCSTYLATCHRFISASDKDIKKKHICFTDQQGTWNKRHPDTNPDTHHEARNCVCHSV